MDDRARAALDKSILYWEELIARQRLPGGWQTCPLCQEYNYMANPGMAYASSCRGCPVREETGLQFCYGSPYEAADKAKDYDPTIWQAELDFLRSLRPAT